jgi:hypothetical protein
VTTLIILAELACAYLAVGLVLFVSLLIRERPTLNWASMWAFFCLIWPFLFIGRGMRM